MTDPREEADLAQRHPDVLAQLSAHWEEAAAQLLPYPERPARVPDR